MLLTTSKEPLNPAEVQVIRESLVISIHWCDDQIADTSLAKDHRAMCAYERRNYQHMLDRLRA